MSERSDQIGANSQDSGLNWRHHDLHIVAPPLLLNRNTSCASARDTHVWRIPSSAAAGASPLRAPRRHRRRRVRLPARGESCQCLGANAEPAEAGAAGQVHGPVRPGAIACRPGVARRAACRDSHRRQAGRLDCLDAGSGDKHGVRCRRPVVRVSPGVPRRPTCGDHAPVPLGRDTSVRLVPLRLPFVLQAQAGSPPCTRQSSGLAPGKAAGGAARARAG